MEKSRINLSEIHSWVFRSKGCYACNLFPNSSETCMRVHVCVCVEREYTQSEQGKTLTLCWSWSSNTLATWHEELTHWKRPWCWERLKARRRRGWLDDITDSMHIITDLMNTSLTKLQELVTGREAWRPAVHGVTKSRTWLSNWTELNTGLSSYQNTELLQ